MCWRNPTGTRCASVARIDTRVGPREALTGACTGKLIDTRGREVDRRRNDHEPERLRQREAAPAATQQAISDGDVTMARSRLLRCYPKDAEAVRCRTSLRGRNHGAPPRLPVCANEKITKRYGLLRVCGSPAKAPAGKPRKFAASGVPTPRMGL
jgi:hypothetical protein